MSLVYDPETPLLLVDEEARDQQARLDALDVSQSFLVKAPAGSGKTELLTRRLLALLSVVENPEDVLAITFTRAATAEMRDRVLTALRSEEKRLRSGEPAIDTQARAALAQSMTRGWSLLEQPQRLNILTIDSLCLRIAHEAPLLSRLGGKLQPTEDALPLYALAARRTMEQLGSGDSLLTRALQTLLRLREVNVAHCEALIANMLARRDQWLADFSATTSHDEADWQGVRALLEEPFRRERAGVLGAVRAIFKKHRGHTERLLGLAAFACSHSPNQPIMQIRDILDLEKLTHLDHYECLRQFLLTQKNEWRRTVNKNNGFPTEKEGGSKKQKADFEELLEELSLIDGLLEALCAVEGLPDESFTEDEWQTVRSIFTVLLHAAAQLRVVFGQKSAIDFLEAGIDAQHAMSDPEVQRRWSGRVHHLLVDEFQDTSRRQYELISRIVSAWEPDEHRTCFLVGDPMQSIYLFRQADLALFKEVQQHGFGDESSAIKFIPLTLSRNFRSSAGIVNPVNEMFAAIGAQNNSGAQDKSQFVPAVANAGSAQQNAVSIVAHLNSEGREDGPQEDDEQEDPPQAVDELEARRVLEIVRRHLPAIAKARAAGEEFRVAVLTRARRHVARIAATLRDASIAYRAVELEALEERQEIIDLASLVRALLSPLDRIAWLSILRAPWCGLSLPDLHMLAGKDDPALWKLPMPELMKTRLVLLSEDGAARAGRLFETMQLAIDQRFSGQFTATPNGFAAWVERTWTTLGGRHCISEDAYQNVQAFFYLLARLKPDGSEASAELLSQRLARLYATPSTESTERAGVQIMTIHKAKGLGFNVVIVPALERKTGNNSDTPLLQWMERTRRGGNQRELLIAPIGSKSEESGVNYKWVCKQRQKEEDEELNRVLYVACTRARSELHLFGTLGIREEKTGKTSSRKVCRPAKRSLLATGWPYFESFFDAQLAERPTAGPERSLHLVPQLRASGQGLQIAAAATVTQGQTLYRLPSNWSPKVTAPAIENTAPQGSHEYGRGSFPFKGSSHQALQTNGIVVHALFQQMASLPDDDPRKIHSLSGEYWQRIASALLRNMGLGRRDVTLQTEQVLKLLTNAADDAHGRWILGRRPQARSESAWASHENGSVRMVRADRVFIAGAEPLDDRETHLWIVDYKTTAVNAELDLFLQEERSRHESQLAGYGRVLRAALPCDLPVRYALYYPSASHLDWWSA